MDFLLWVCRVMHIFAAIVWLGGLMFEGAVMVPILQMEDHNVRSAMKRVHKRFTGFVWMCVWTMLITGLCMMMFNPRFVWFQYNTPWRIYLGIKQLVFLLMMLYAFGYARMLAYLNSPASNGGYDAKSQLYAQRLTQFRRISIFLGIVALLLAAGMVQSG
jgi:uncharacterized membrane protein